MFAMTKVLAGHMTTLTSEPSASVEKKPKTKRAAGSSVFNAAHILSPQLAALVDATELSRPQCVKRIWEHIKANQLQDAKDGRYIMCDKPMQLVFKKTRLSMFKMNAVLLVDAVTW